MLKKLPDLERVLNRLYTYSIKKKFTAVYFQNVSFQKINELRSVLISF
jgi:DNA mismatch repair ATPase MutS